MQFEVKDPLDDVCLTLDLDGPPGDQIVFLREKATDKTMIIFEDELESLIEGLTIMKNTIFPVKEAA